MSKELQVYICANCGREVALLVARPEPFRCVYCGGLSMSLVGDDRATRLGTTKPAKTVTK